jgi:cytochrome c oxidase assembly protein subunit 15
MVMATLLVIFQGLLGWFMVKSGLIDNPHVSHYRLASHLFLAFILLAYTYCNRLTLNNNNNNNNNKIDKSLFFHIKNLFILYIIQVLFGAFIAGTKAGLLWNTFPLMEGQLIPDGLLALNPFYLNFFENMKMFQFVHRLIGTLLVVYSGWFFIKSQKQFYNKYSGLLFMTLMMQFYIGIMTLILKVPLLFGVLHQAIAAIILLIIVHILFLMNNSKFINR